MDDERFVFYQDLREKKAAARSSHNRRTHNGKGGSVKFPSDYLSKKELQAMNGEVKSYRLKDPMTWAEFKALPDDLKVSYIRALRQKYSVLDARIAEMFGVSPYSVSVMFNRLGISGEKVKGSKGFDAEGWYAWRNGIQSPKAPVADEQPEPIPQIVEEAADRTDEGNITPCSGQMTFVGTADAALKMVSQILGGGIGKNHRFLGKHHGRRGGTA